MPKYIIHIGPPKSGSKYLQTQLFYNRQFLEDNGVLYPDNWWTRPTDRYHFSLFDHLRQATDGLESEFEKINQRGFDRVILSSEALDGLEPKEIQRLQDAIGGNPVEIVYYARRWSERLPSDWRERVKMGQFVTFPKFYIPLLSDPEGTGEINYHTVWERFANVFGRHSLKIVSFSNLLDHRIDFFDHFCRVILGLPSTPQTAKENVQYNKSTSVIDTEIIRALNYIYYFDTSQLYITMQVKFLRLKANRDAKVLNWRQELEKHLNSDLRQIKVDDKAAAFDEAWQAISTYADCLVSPEYGRDIFERQVVNLQLAGQNYLLQSGVLNILQELYQYLKAAEVKHPLLKAAV